MFTASADGCKVVLVWPLPEHPHDLGIALNPFVPAKIVEDWATQILMSGLGGFSIEEFIHCFGVVIAHQYTLPISASCWLQLGSQDG